MLRRIILFTIIALLLITMVVVEKMSNNRWSELKTEDWTTLASIGLWSLQVDKFDNVRTRELDPELD